MLNFLKAPESCGAGDADYWDKYNADWKSDRPFSYWLHNIYWHKRIWWKTRDGYYACYRRFKDKMYLIDTGLNRWDYHGTDEKILHGSFILLVEHMERSFDQSGSREEYEEFTESLKTQALWQHKDQVLKLELYDWWTSERQEFIDSEPEHEETKFEDESVLFRLSKRFEENYPIEYATWIKWCEEHRVWEQACYDKDNEMLAKLVSIRNSLWI